MTYLSPDPPARPLTERQQRRDALLVLADPSAAKEIRKQRHREAWESNPEYAAAVVCSHDYTRRRGGRGMYDSDGWRPSFGKPCTRCDSVIGCHPDAIVRLVEAADAKARIRYSYRTSPPRDDDARWHAEISSREPGNVEPRFGEVALNRAAWRAGFRHPRHGSLWRSITYGSAAYLSEYRVDRRSPPKYDLCAGMGFLSIPRDERQAPGLLYLSREVRVRQGRGCTLVLERLIDGRWEPAKKKEK